MKNLRLGAMTLTFLLANAASVVAGQYPPEAAKMLWATCQQRHDIPAQYTNDYCSCYVDLVQKNVSWQDWQLLDSAADTKGMNGLDAEEKNILGKALETTSYCSQKYVK